MPKEITILGKTYTITIKDDDGMQGLMGSAKRTENKIDILDNQSAESAKETLLHEVIHIIDGELLLNLSEETVARLAVGLYSAGLRLPEGKAHGKE